MRPDHEDADDDGQEEEEEEEEAVPEQPTPEPRPTLAEYEEKWRRLEAHHAREVVGDFGAANLVPRPVPQLWQGCPFLPFDKLVSDESQARLSRCKPISGLEPANHCDGVARYAHCQGEVNFGRRAPLSGRVDTRLRLK